MIGSRALSISEVAKHRRSAIRYYERLGILSPRTSLADNDATMPPRRTG